MDHGTIDHRDGRLFDPSTRFQDRYRDYYQGGRANFVEVQLTEGCAGEILLHRGFTWEDFYSFASGKIVWINPNVFFDLSPIRICDQDDYKIL
jgi:hypothetical protein